MSKTSLLPKVIYDKLSNLNILTGADGLLAENYPIKDDLRSVKSKKNSIIMDTMLEGENIPDNIFITFGFGLSNAVELSEFAQLFIRIYDNVDTSHGYNLRLVKDVIKEELSQIALTGSKDGKNQIFYFQWQLEQPVRKDEAFNSVFIELEFEVQIP